MADKKFYKFQSRTEHLTDRIEGGKPDVPSEFGMCSKCTYFAYYRTKLGTEYFGCENHDNLRPRIIKSDPIVSCRSFEEKGKLTLNTMWNMATFIDVSDKKIGFDLKREIKSYKVEDEELVSPYE